MSLQTYQIIYADPPWRYNFSRTTSRSIETKYSTMSLADIKALPIPAADNCILYLWATAPKLLEALAVMAAWGFTYKSHSVWDKKKLGIGYWWRGQHELLLVGTKGKMPPPPPHLRERSVYREKRSEHSKKPEYFRDAIKRAYPDLKKIELFARGDVLPDLFGDSQFDGWDVWGNEVNDGTDNY